MRIPITPHEIGSDSFVTHSIANSISSSGYAKWWIHPLSIVGFYLYSTASALPFYLSGASQSMNLDMEWTIWVVLLSFGIFSAFTAYLMAGAIKDVEIFKFITAFVYSTSLGILIFTTWNASARGLFMVLLPLFIYFLIKYRFSELKYGILTGILFLLLMATHNIIFLVIPIIISFGIIMIINHLMSNSKNIAMAVPITIRNSKPSNIFRGAILLIIFTIVFVLTFIMLSDKIGIQTYTTTVNSTYMWFLLTILSYVRYIGILIVFAIGGFIFLLFKHDKTFEELFLILVMFSLTPILPLATYGKFFILPVAALLISIGIMNLITISEKRKTALFLMIILFVLSACVSTFYQFGRTDIGQSQQSEFWASDSTFEAAMWIKTNTNKPIYTDNNLLSRRILAYSDAPMLSETNIINFIQNISYKESLEVVMRSPFSVEFYGRGPYKKEIGPDLIYNWYKLRNVECDGKWGKRIIPMFDLNYYIKDENYASTIFSRSVYKQDNKLFDNGKVSVWDL